MAAKESGFRRLCLRYARIDDLMCISLTGEERSGMANPDKEKLDKLVSESRRARELRDQGYREQALKMYPPICGRCGREFTRKNLHELTVHHRDHDHDNNPADGSNWELLCMYCHDNEHQRQLEAQRGNTATGGGKNTTATFNPFADLKSMLDGKVKKD
jgi:5-methylcytosine-specific restriction endonuclease McrA